MCAGWGSGGGGRATSAAAADRAAGLATRHVVVVVVVLLLLRSSWGGTIAPTCWSGTMPLGVHEAAAGLAPLAAAPMPRPDPASCIAVLTSWRSNRRDTISNLAERDDAGLREA
jgi:hypothetical protein